jgi:hypothetical protein
MVSIIYCATGEATMSGSGSSGYKPTAQAGFALDATRTLHRLGYFWPDISPQISHWICFIATVLLGYRTDQILKKVDNRIEINRYSTLL